MASESPGGGSSSSEQTGTGQAETSGATAQGGTAANAAASAASAASSEGADSSSADVLDPSILEAVGQANAEISRSASGGVAAASGDASSAGAPGGNAGQSEIDDLLKRAAFEDPKTVGVSAGGEAGAAGGPTAAGAPFELPSLASSGGAAAVSSIDLLKDVELNVKIELGRSRMLVEDVLKLSEGSVVELDKLAGDPVDVFVNDRLVARGEVLVLNDNFCVRVNEIVAGLRDDVL